MKEALFQKGDIVFVLAIDEELGTPSDEVQFVGRIFSEMSAGYLLVEPVFRDHDALIVHIKYLAEVVV